MATADEDILPDDNARGEGVCKEASGSEVGRDGGIISILREFRVYAGDAEEENC